MLSPCFEDPTLYFEDTVFQGLCLPKNDKIPRFLPEHCSMCSYRWSEHISHICSLYVLSLLCCQDWFLNSFFWFLKGSWHCSHSFGLADFAPTISLSMIAFICLESRGFGTLEMMTYTWRSHSVSFVYNFVSVDLRVCWPFLRLSCSFFFFSSWELCCLFEKTACDSECIRLVQT